MYRFSLLILLVIQCCTDKNKTINVHYFSDNGDTLKVELIEQLDTIRRFSKTFTIPVKYYKNGKLKKFYKNYTDNYFYLPNTGLHKKLNSNCTYFLENFAGHFQDFIWIPNYYFDSESINYISFDDRDLATRAWNEYSFDLRKYNISLLNMEHSIVFGDTLYTIFFNDVNLCDEDEIRVYDSKFNMVEYIKVVDDFNDSLNVYKIELEEYEKLKLFRSDFIPMF